MLASQPSSPLERGHNGGVSHLYRDEAVVLRTQKPGEADRIVTLLTRELGRVRDADLATCLRLIFGASSLTSYDDLKMCRSTKVE